MKSCSSCNAAKDLDAFNKDRAAKDGLQHLCRDCQREFRKAWKSANRAHVIQYDRDLRKTNKPWLKEKVRERQRRYFKRLRTDNPDKARALDKKYPERKRNSRHNRRSCTQKGTVDWNKKLQLFDFCCAYCGIKSSNLQLEHVVPLSRGGGHHEDNVVPACKTCNCSKGSRLLLEWVWART